MRRIGWMVVMGGLLFPAAGAAQSGQAGRLHDMINHHREEIGCLPLTWHGPSATVAAARSADMHTRGYFDHATPDGRNVFDELADAGIKARAIAENIALTQAGPSSVMELWIESKPHRRNIEDCAFTHEALAVQAGLWTQILLAQPRAASSLARPAADSPSARATPRP